MVGQYRRVTLSPTLVCAPAEGETATGRKTEVTLTRQNLVRAYCASRFFLLPGGQLCLTNARRSVSLPKMSIPEERKQR